MSRSRIALVVLFFATALVPLSPAHAAYTVVCTGYASCEGKGYSHGGYESHRGTSYWNMYTGTNCTNYVAYRLVTTNGMPNKRPKAGVGNARDWGTTMSSITDSTPTIGSVAWWGRTGNHVAYVERVVSANEIWVSESNWSGAFDWRKITRSGSGWPDGFIHFADPKIVNQTKPAISGTVRVGGALKASGGVWDPKGNTYAYQWRSNGKAISGATAKTFTPAAAHRDTQLTIAVTATRPGFPTTVAVSPASVVLPGTMSASVAPTLSGVARVNGRLTATTGTWTPTPSAYRYRWYVDGQQVLGADTPTFTILPQHAGKRVNVRVFVSRSGYDAAASSSAPTAAIATAPLSASRAPVVTGTPKVGSRLSASTGTWSTNGLTYGYQWLADGRPIAGATSSTFVAGAAEHQRRLTVQVTARRTGYTTTTSTSAPTAAVTAGTISLRSLPVLSGNARVGSRLTASTGSWSPTAAYSFQWYADGKQVAGATARTFVPTHRQRGAEIRVRVTARRDGYTTTSSMARQRPVVVAGRIKVTTRPVITGDVRRGEVLRVRPAVTRPDQTTVRYQWLRDGKRIAGATKASRRVSVHDVGHRLSVRVTFKAPGYSSLATSTKETRRARASR